MPTTMRSAASLIILPLADFVFAPRSPRATRALHQCRAPKISESRSSSSGVAYVTMILPRRSLPMIRTRVIRPRCNASSSDSSSTDRRRPRRSVRPLATATVSVARMESSVVRTDQSLARIWSRRRNCSAVLVTASNARAWPLVGRPLLKLREEIQADLRNGRLTMGHARALLAVTSTAEQFRLRDQILANDWSVRTTEDSIRATETVAVAKGLTLRRGRRRSVELESLEEALQRGLMTRVRIIGNERRGKIMVTYATPDELERLSEIFGARH